MNRRCILLLMLAIMMLALTGCVPGDGQNSETDSAGFFWGIWHGWIAPISLVIGLFNHNIRVYEVHNTGWWYDLGFFLAVASGFGGLTITRRRNVKRRN